MAQGTCRAQLARSTHGIWLMGHMQLRVTADHRRPRRLQRSAPFGHGATNQHSDMSQCSIIGTLGDARKHGMMWCVKLSHARQNSVLVILNHAEAFTDMTLLRGFARDHITADIPRHPMIGSSSNLARMLGKGMKLKILKGLTIEVTFFDVSSPAHGRDENP